MKLLLASSDLTPSLLAQLKRLVGAGRHSELSALIILNACDFRGESFQKNLYADIVKQLNFFIDHCALLDLRDFDRKKTDNDKLAKIMQDADVVLVAGGNSFYLLYYMKRSGFDKCLRQELENGLVYCGTSAGSMVMSPRMTALDKMDDPAMAPEVIQEGLGLIHFIYVPHADNQSYHSGDVIKELDRKKLAYKAVEESGALLVRDDQVKLVE